MRKKVRRSLKSLMLMLMALVTATATLVSASSYSIRIEHIWDDDNNSGNTRPENGIKEEVSQKEGKDGPKKDNYIEGGKLDTGSDAGAAVGKEDGTNAGYQLNQTLEDQTKPEEPKPDDPNPEDPKPDDPNPEDPKPDDPNPEDPKPDDPDSSTSEVTKPVRPDDPDYGDEPDGDEPDWDATAPEDPGKEYDETKFESQEAYESAKEEYERYKAWETYRKECTKKDEQFKKDYDEYVKAIKKLAGVTDETYLGHDDGFAAGYKEAFDKALVDAYESGEIGTTSTTRPQPTVDIDQLRKDLASNDLNGQTVYDVAQTIQKLVDETIENKWAVDHELKEDGSETQERHQDGDKIIHGKPLNYDAIIDEVSKADLTNAGYTTETLRIKVVLLPDWNSDKTDYVKDENGEIAQRVYVSIDGGTSWHPANQAAIDWDADPKHDTYNMDSDLVDQTVITFLHTLKKPSDDDNNGGGGGGGGDPKDPPKKPQETPPPEEVVEEPPVPLAPPEEVPEEVPEEEEIPEPDVPLTEIPATGDSSSLWMISALFSGVALLALLKKRDGDAEAEEA